MTTISFTLKDEDHISLVIYDVLGRRVVVLDGVQAAGEHSIAFDATRLPSGMYFVLLETSASMPAAYARSAKAGYGAVARFLEEPRTSTIKQTC